MRTNIPYVLKNISGYVMKIDQDTPLKNIINFVGAYDYTDTSDTSKRCSYIDANGERVYRYVSPNDLFNLWETIIAMGYVYILYSKALDGIYILHNEDSFEI